MRTRAQIQAHADAGNPRSAALEALLDIRDLLVAQQPKPPAPCNCVYESKSPCAAGCEYRRPGNPTSLPCCGHDPGNGHHPACPKAER